MKCFVFDAMRFERQTKNPHLAQKKVLFDILKQNQNTLFGKEHKFSSIKTLQDFQKNVPTNDYESLRPYIKKMLAGRQNILIKDKPIFFGLTSGTTGNPKFVPVTKCSRKQKANVMDLWLYYMIHDHPRIFADKVLAIMSPEIEGYTKSGIPYGSESGHGYRNIPGIIRKHYCLPYEVFSIQDYEARYYTILRLGLEANITNLATMNPSTLLLLCQKIEKYAPLIIEDIKQGTLNSSFKIEPNIRKSITKPLTPNLSRAKFLENILQKKGALLPKDFWPNLALIECWKGGSVSLYFQELKKYFPDKIGVRDFGYLSTEARCSIPRSDQGCSGILTVGTNFYEFVKEEDFNKPDKEYISVEKLEKDKRYFIFFTTCAGLYRYHIDDIVKVTGFYNQTPLIEFVQKGQNVSSVTGEKLYEIQVTQAMNKTREQTKLDVEFFCCYLDWRIPPRYSFLIEFIEEPNNSQKLSFLQSLEENLCRINIEYKTKRKSERLSSPTLKILERGSFERFRKTKLQDLPHDSQFKFSHLKADFKIPDEFKIKEEVYLGMPIKVFPEKAKSLVK